MHVVLINVLTFFSIPNIGATTKIEKVRFFWAHAFIKRHMHVGHVHVGHMGYKIRVASKMHTVPHSVVWWQSISVKV